MPPTMTEKQAEKAMDTCPCRPNEWTGRVVAGDPRVRGGSSWVCGLASHREAAEAYYGLLFPDLDITFVPKGS